MKVAKECAWEVTKQPTEKNMDETSTMYLGEKMVASFPIKGDVVDAATRNDVVNHMAFSYESRSAAMVDWAIVMPLMFIAVGVLN